MDSQKKLHPNHKHMQFVSNPACVGEGWDRDRATRKEDFTPQKGMQFARVTTRKTEAARADIAYSCEYLVFALRRPFKRRNFFCKKLKVRRIAQVTTSPKI